MNERFIDVDFSKEPRYVMGHLGERPEDEKKFRRYEDVAHIYPRSQWKELAAEMKARGGGLSQLIIWILNQLKEGSCVGNGSTGAVQAKQAQQFGKERTIQLSAMSLYKRIGQSAQSGAVVSDALEALQAHGELPLDTPENKERFKHTMAATGFSQKMPAGWEETGKSFKVDEVTLCKTVDEVVSAGFDEHPTVVGRDGHCVYYTDPIWSEKTGGIVMAYANSWGKWGEPLGHLDYGFGFDSERLISSAAHGCYTIRSVTCPTFQV